MFHEHAVGEHNNMHQQTNYDHLPPPSERSSLNDISEISLSIPRGKAVAMPSVRISEEEEQEIKRNQYGGVGDKPHLGGFTEFDVSNSIALDFIHDGHTILLTIHILCIHDSSQPLGVSPSMWKHMVRTLSRHIQ